jgi:hypothetical protein
MADRVDENGAAYAGSQLQTQLYVNTLTAKLDAALRQAFSELASAQFEWRSPLAADGYREYSDKAFLERVELGHHAAELKAFWPTGGPHWDALAIVRRSEDARPGVVLAEGKSYPGELYGSGCAAKPKSLSRAQIKRSLTWTQNYLGLQGASVETWCGPLYQSANRLAHLAWLQSLGVRAWLVHLLFLDDPHSPTSAVEWNRALEKANRELGLPETALPGAGHALLPAGSREKLLRHVVGEDPN